MLAKIILYGCGNVGKEALQFFGEEFVAYFCDSRTDLTGKKNYGKEIISMEQLKRIHRDYILIISTVLRTADEIVDALSEQGIEDFLVFKCIPQSMFDEMSISEFIKKYSNPTSRRELQRDYYKYRVDLLKYQITYLKNHADITNLKPAVGKLREIQLEQVEVANEFFEYISELNIKPFLIGGGLIGAVRHRGFVPWDDDLDFGLMRDDYDRLLEFCKKRCTVYMYRGSWADFKSVEVPKDDYWKLLEEHENEWILGITVDEIWVERRKGSKCAGISFWPFDFYREGYTLKEHISYLKYIDEKREEIGCVPEIVRFLQKEIAENDNISKQPTGKIQPGIDNGMWRRTYKMGRGWIKTEDMLPLEQRSFEQTLFFTPHDPRKFLEYDYPDYMEFPNDFGIPQHIKNYEELL